MDRIDAEGVAEWIRRERVTLWNGPPALLHSLTGGEVEAEALASLTELWSGGGDCPESLRERFAEKFGVTVLVSYGLSEAPTVVTLDPQDGDHRPGASGRPSPQLAVEVRDDEGRALPAGERGEICVGPAAEGPWAGSYRTMLGYWGQEGATPEALAGGVLHTGDVGFFDADGFLHVVDRKSLMIIRGGANIYPAEVERVLIEAPNVVACAAFGIADERLGERVVAAVELAEGSELDADGLTAHCRESLARFKVPERFVAVAALPRNAMGKVQRDGLVQLLD
jgi:acyl-CoA synthetase (AMP-forming)/AMP-acid ligase II